MYYNNKVIIMLELIDTFIDTTLNSLGVFGPILGCFLIVIESMVPILPLFVFITLNFLSFGHFWGFIISWIFTCIGCSISFFLFRKKVQTWLYKRLKKRGIISKESIDKITNLRTEQLALIIALPATPAFMVNIVAGLSQMSYKKFLSALLIGKIFLVYFCGYIGCSLIESLKHPEVLIKVGIMLLIAYVLGKIVSKKFKIE